MATLRFHTIIANCIGREKNVLNCIGAGLGSLEVMSEFLRASLLNEPKGLWILLNLTQSEVDNLTSLFEVVDICGEKIDSKSREATYKQGGAVHVTGRTLIADVLEQKLDPLKVNSIMIHNVDKLGSACNEMFIVSLIRGTNPNISVKLFTEKPFLINLNEIKEFGISKILCWPKNKFDISEELKNVSGHWEKINLAPSGATLQIHNLLLEMIQICLDEIKRSNKTINLEELTVKNALLKKHIDILKENMDYKIRNLPAKTKTLCENIEEIRKMLKKLEHCDSIEFFEFIFRFMKYIREQASDNKASQGIWHNMEDKTEELIRVSRNRVMRIDGENVQFNIIPNKKWQMLAKLIKEATEKEANGNILIIAPYSVNQAYLKQYIVAYLKGTPEVVLEFKLKSLLEFYNPLLTHESKNITAQQQIGAVLNELKQKYEVSFTLEPSESFPTPIFNQIVNENDPIFQELALDSFGYSWLDFEIPNWSINICSPSQISNVSSKNPTHIFICSYDLTLIRKIEIFAALSRDIEFPLKSVIFFSAPLYENLLFSYTQQAEITGFSHLLTSQIPQPLSIEENSCKIIVDKREFSSMLPYELYKQGIQVIPATLQVGDYILTPNICVERKSVTTDDIFQSLNSGRLHDQLINMKAYYERCILLIEFREDTEFSLSGPNNRSLACLHLSQLLSQIPGISLFWSTTPEQSAKLFLQLKNNQLEPNLTEALQKGNNSNDTISLISAIPGITSETLPTILRNFSSISKIAQSSLLELENMLGSKSASLIFSFFNSQITSHKLN